MAAFLNPRNSAFDSVHNTVVSHTGDYGSSLVQILASYISSSTSKATVKHVDHPFPFNSVLKRYNNNKLWNNLHANRNYKTD